MRGQGGINDIIGTSFATMTNYLMCVKNANADYKTICGC